MCEETRVSSSTCNLRTLAVTTSSVELVLACWPFRSVAARNPGCVFPEILWCLFGGAIGESALAFRASETSDDTGHEDTFCSSVPELPPRADLAQPLTLSECAESRAMQSVGHAFRNGALGTTRRRARAARSCATRSSASLKPRWALAPTRLTPWRWGA